MAETGIPIEDQLAEAIVNGVTARIVALSSELHPADLATFINNLDEEDWQTILSCLDRDTFAETLEHLPATDAANALTERPEEEQQQALESLPDDELVDLLQEVPEPQKEEYLDLLSDDKKAVSSDLLRFPEHTAGGRMTTAFAAVEVDMTIRQAIALLSEIKESTEVLSRIFVIDGADKLLGKIRLRDLTFNKRDTLVREVMDHDTMAIPALADQEEAARMIRKYDLVALPVIDENERLLGVVTHDDAIEILEEESTEDIEKFSAITTATSDAGYLQEPVSSHFRRRFFWILPLALLAIISGIVIYRYEKVLDQVYLLVIFLPMVVAAGGNTGSQSATTVIRAMSLDEFGPSAFLRVISKEVRIGLLLGSMLGLLVALVVRYVLPHFMDVPEAVSMARVAGVVGFSLTAQVTTSTLLGALLPILARSARLDPAVVASPAITTIVDTTGLVIYFALARTLLGI